MLPKIGNRQSLSEQAYLVIKNAILQNKIKPKDVLSEESLAADLGISRTPLRAALKRLEFEHLIYSNSSRQAVVAEVNVEDAAEAYALRVAVEPVIARLLATRGLPKQYAKKLDENLKRQAQAFEVKNLVDVVTSGLEFDYLLAEATENNFFIEVVGRINIYMQRVLTLSKTHEHDAPLAVNEHREILAAITDGNADKAERLSRLHLYSGAERLGFKPNVAHKAEWFDTDRSPSR